MTRRFFCSAVTGSLLAVLMGILGCSAEPSPPRDRIEDGWSENEEYVSRLVAMANQLAADEFARLSAAEMIYRNDTYYYENTSLNPGSVSGAYAKLYRQFVDFEVADIVESRSIIYPVTVIVEYHFELLGTRSVPVSGRDIGSAETAQSDHRFVVQGQGVIRRRYVCDAAGKVLPGIARILDRPDYWRDVEGFPDGSMRIVRVSEL